MRQEEKAHAIPHVPIMQLAAHGLGDIVQSLATGGDLEGGLMPVHKNLFNHEGHKVHKGIVKGPAG